MDIEDLRKMVRKQWSTEKAPLSPLGRARFVTGLLPVDSHLDLLETEYGLRLILDYSGREIESYQILDDKKFTIFILRWS